MKQPTHQFPLYAKITLILLSLSIITVLLYLAQGILIPLLLSLLFAILLRPLVVFLHKRLKFPHIIAALVSVTLFVIVIASIVFFISWQVSDIANDWQKIKNNISIQLEGAQNWINQQFHVSHGKQQNYVKILTGDTLNGLSKSIGTTINSFTNTFLNIVLIPIYTFLILLYRNLFINFLSKLVSQKNENILLDILTHIKIVVKSYVVGLMIQTAVVGVLTTGGLMLIGVQYAVLLGIITAILNLIPYIGILVACVITLLATLVDATDISVIVGVITLTLVVQFIDNNILVPKIVGNKVRINALASVVGVVVGGAIAGVTGMFLAIPLIAILKVIFDRIDSLAPWGFLLGDELPKTFKWHKLKLPKFSKKNSDDPSS